VSATALSEVRDSATREGPGVPPPSALATRTGLGWLALVALLVFLTAWGGIALTRETGRIATIWFANAVLLAAVLRTAPGSRLALYGAGFLANLAANVGSGDGPLTAAALALLNSGEVALAAVLLRRLVPDLDLARPRGLAIFCLVALGPAPAASALLAASYLALVQDASFFQTLITWYPADALGLVIFTPLLLAARRDELAALVAPARIAGTLGVLAAVIGTVVLVFAQTRYPLLFLLFPMFALAAFRLGFSGTVAVIILIAGLALGFTIGGAGPLALISGDFREQVLVLQGFLAVAVLMALQIAAVLTERARLVTALREAKENAERIEAERRASEERLRLTLDNMDQGLMMVDAEGRLPLYNRRARELLDLPADLMDRRPTGEEVIAYQTAQGEFEGINDHARRRLLPSATGEGHSIYERERPNGTVLEIRTAPLPGGGVVRTYTDITARRAAERAVEESEALYRLMAENSSDMIGRSSFEGIRRYVSSASTRILGYTPEELIGTRAFDYIHPDDLDRALAATRLVATGAQERGACTYRCRHKDGHWVWVEVRFELARDPATGAPFEFISAMRDVTEREAQAEELRRAKEAAERASEAKTEFLATMSHEIRTPLNAVIGFTDIILDRRDVPAEVRHRVEQIGTAGTALLTIVNDILDFSKIEAGEIVLDPRPFALDALIDNVVSIVSDAATAKHLALKVEPASSLPIWLVGDDTRLRQILLNLLNNAVKFTEAGHVALRVRRTAGPDGDPRVHLRFAIADTGIGITPEQQELLFRRFTQVDGSIQRRFGGTGLGLAISKRLVEMMDGRIGVESELGRGAVFWFTVALPLADPLAMERDATSAGAAPGGRSARILVVEDVETNQEIARAALESAGHQVEIAGDGHRAVEAARGGGYDLILMDIQMPGMNGIAATEQIRRLPGAAGRVPIIAMTANVLPDQVARFRRAGMNDHVGKPFRRTALFRTVERWVGPPPPAPGTGSAPAPDLSLSAGVTGDLEDFEEAPSGPPPEFDRAIYDDMLRLMGPEKFGRIVERVAELLGQGLVGEPPGEPPGVPPGEIDRKALAATAHSAVSVTGMIGFMALSAQCRALEIACGEDADIAGLREQVRLSSAQALATLADLRGGS
jgi:PAS domain S-box-containing protein